MGTRDRRGDLPAERRARAVPAAALLHPAGRPVRRSPPARRRRALRRAALLPPPLGGRGQVGLVLPGRRSAILPSRSAAGRNGSVTSLTSRSRLAIESEVSLISVIIGRISCLSASSSSLERSNESA